MNEIDCNQNFGWEIINFGEKVTLENYFNHFNQCQDDLGYQKIEINHK